MEDNIFICCDASYSPHTNIAGLGVIDTFADRKYSYDVCNIENPCKAEFYTLAFAIKIAIKSRYSNVVFVYDCKSLEIEGLKEYASKKIKTVQFLWLKITYLKEADSLARKTRKLVEKLKIKEATDKELKQIQCRNTIKKRISLAAIDNNLIRLFKVMKENKQKGILQKNII